MSRMNQVMQIGNIEGDIHYYIEDYAYTYLKKQKGKEKTKYFLYGEKEENSNPKKVYIYGIAEKPKMEQTYFKEYYPLGFLKVKNDETFWITLKGQEQKMSGFYVFYAPNQAMQEYLVDHREEEKPDKPEDKAKRQLVGETLPMKETFVPARKIRSSKSKEFKNEKFVFPVGGIIVACLILLVLTSANGQKKMKIFKQVIAQTISGVSGNVSEEEFIIEEKNIKQDNTEEENYATSESVPEENHVNQEEAALGNDTGDKTIQEDNPEEAALGNDTGDETIYNAEPEEAESETILETGAENVYEEYVVKNGDTLVAICKSKYGSLDKMEEICTINNIKNADYIAPGQKLYLP